MPDLSRFDLSPCLSHWQTDNFKYALEEQLKQLPEGSLPLVYAMQTGSYPLADSLRVMILDSTQNSDEIILNCGLFFDSVIAGCNCADDPTPVERYPEYGEFTFTINKHSGKARCQISKD